MVARVYTPARGVESRLIDSAKLAETQSQYDALLAKIADDVELSDLVFGAVAGFDFTAISAMRRAKRFSKMTKAVATQIRNTLRHEHLQLDIKQMEQGVVAGSKRAAGVKQSADPAAALLALLALPGVKDNPEVLKALKALLG